MTQCRTILVLILSVLCASVYSQLQVPQFASTIYFEDMSGNKDSLVVGYDSFPHSLSSSSCMSELYGFNNYNTKPWDSLFEVRAIHSGAPCYSKGAILSNQHLSNAWGFHGYGVIKVHLRTNEPLIKISWDSTDYLIDSLITESAFGFSNSFQFHSPLPEVHTLFKDAKERTILVPNHTSITGSYNVTTQNGQQGIVYIMYIFLSRVPLIRNWSSTADYGVTDTTDIFIYPNPTSDILNIDFANTGGGFRVSVYNIQTGRVMYNKYDRYRDQLFILNVSDYPAGSYVIEIYYMNRDGNQRSYKKVFIKQ